MRALIVLACAALLPARAAAEPLGSHAARPAPWRESWAPFTSAEGVTTVTAGVLTFALALQTPPSRSRWRGGVLFDDALRARMRLETGASRARARLVGDVSYYAAPVLPLIVDPLVAWLAHDDAGAAGDLALMGLSAFSYAGLLSFVSTSVSRRERPDTTECWRGSPSGEGCEFDTEAFWSGHTSIAATAAGLSCAHHQYLALWGNPWADLGACALSLSGALTTATSRLLADRHYASDVAVGLSVGFAIGYAVPALLHYRRALPVSITFGTEPRERGGSLRVSGAF